MSLFSRTPSSIPQPQSSEDDIQRVRAGAASGFQIKGATPELSAAAGRVLANAMREQQYAPMAPPQPVISGRPNPASFDGVGRRGLTPLWAFDTNDIEAQSLPTDRYAEVDFEVIEEMYRAHARENPTEAVTGVTTGPGTITLSAPGSIDAGSRVLVPGLLLSFSLVESSGSMGNIALSVAGFLEAGHHFVAGALATRSANFSTGSAIFAMRRKDQKCSILLTPYRVVGGRTYPAAAQLAAANTLSVNAQTLTVTVSAASAGTVVEATALTVQHAYYRDMLNSLRDLANAGRP